MNNTNRKVKPFKFTVILSDTVSSNTLSYTYTTTISEALKVYNKYLSVRYRNQWNKTKAPAHTLPDNITVTVWKIPQGRTPHKGDMLIILTSEDIK